MLFGRRRAFLVRHKLDVGSDMQRPQVDDQRDTPVLAPREEIPGRLAAGTAAVHVADMIDEELPRAG